MPAPARVRKRDGRVEPFALAKLTRSLYAARREHAPDHAAAHAAELARAVAHFLALDDVDPAPSADIRRHALTALRELGHEETARRYAAGGPKPPAPRPAPPPRPTAWPADLALLARDGALRLGVGRRPWRQAWTTVSAAPWSAGGAAEFLALAQRSLAAARRLARRVVLRRLDLAAAASSAPAAELGERFGLLLAAWGPRGVVRLTPSPGARDWAELDGGPLFGPPPDADARLAAFHQGLATALALFRPEGAWLPLLEGALPHGTAWDGALQQGCRLAAWRPPAEETAEGLAVARIDAGDGRTGVRSALAEAAVRGAVAFRESLRRRGADDRSAAALALVDASGSAEAAAELRSVARRSAAAARLPLAAEPALGVPFAATAGRQAFDIGPGCRSLAELNRRWRDGAGPAVAAAAAGGAGRATQRA